MAKIAIKNEKITAFGGINFVLDNFDALLGDVIDRTLGIRSTTIDYQYSENIRALFALYICGGDVMEDVNLYLRDALSDRPGTYPLRDEGFFPDSCFFFHVFPPLIYSLKYDLKGWKLQ